MTQHAERRGDAARGGQFDEMALIVVHGKREQIEAGLARQPRRDHRIEPARKQDDGKRLGRCDGFGHAAR